MGLIYTMRGAFCVVRSDCWAMRRPWCVGWATGKIPTLFLFRYKTFRNKSCVFLGMDDAINK